MLKTENYLHSHTILSPSGNFGGSLPLHYYNYLAEDMANCEATVITIVNIIIIFIIANIITIIFVDNIVLKLQMSRFLVFSSEQVRFSKLSECSGRILSSTSRPIKPLLDGKKSIHLIHWPCRLSCWKSNLGQAIAATFFVSLHIFYGVKVPNWEIFGMLNKLIEFPATQTIKQYFSYKSIELFAERNQPPKQNNN